MNLLIDKIIVGIIGIIFALLTYYLTEYLTKKGKDKFEGCKIIIEEIQNKYNKEEKRNRVITLKLVNKPTLKFIIRNKLICDLKDYLKETNYDYYIAKSVGEELIRRMEKKI